MGLQAMAFRDEGSGSICALKQLQDTYMVGS